MSKINQIENALKEIEGGAFQKLANAYLLKKGYQNITGNRGQTTFLISQTRN